MSQTTVTTLAVEVRFSDTKRLLSGLVLCGSEKIQVFGHLNKVVRLLTTSQEQRNDGLPVIVSVY